MAETRRDSLIDAAAELLDRGGPAAVTLREVGRAVGVSHNAPYKHFADKHDLLAAIASRELRRQAAPRSTSVGDEPQQPTARALMIGYVRWATRHPERFKLTFGRWTRENAELAEAADSSRSRLVAAVMTAQAAGDLPAGDPERVTALLLALAHGAADLSLSGHLAADGKGHADPEDLVADLFGYLKTASQ
jgi:AcrR family transcriptional regulator